MGNKYGASFYGTAAVSPELGGWTTPGGWLTESCGKCWKVTGVGNIPGTPTFGMATTLVLRGANSCPADNPLCAQGPHFDIAAPGFDVTQYSFAHSCSTREAAEDSGFGACEFWMSDGNPNNNCDCSKFDSTTLQNGCQNFLELYWNNPMVDYEELSECPPEMVTPCWEENNGGYPDGIPDTCAAPSSDSNQSPVAPPAPVPSPVAPPVLFPPVSPPVAPPVAPPVQPNDDSGCSIFIRLFQFILSLFGLLNLLGFGVELC